MHIYHWPPALTHVEYFCKKYINPTCFKLVPTQITIDCWLLRGVIYAVVFLKSSRWMLYTILNTAITNSFNIKLIWTKITSLVKTAYSGLEYICLLTFENACCLFLQSGKPYFSTLKMCVVGSPKQWQIYTYRATAMKTSKPTFFFWFSIKCCSSYRTVT